MNEKPKEFIDAVIPVVLLSLIVFCSTMLAIQFSGLEKRCDDTKLYVDVLRATKENPNATIIIQPIKNCDCKGDK